MAHLLCRLHFLLLTASEQKNSTDFLYLLFINGIANLPLLVFVHPIQIAKKELNDEKRTKNMQFVVKHIISLAECGCNLFAQYKYYK